MSNYKFETLRLHVGQETPNPAPYAMQLVGTDHLQLTDGQYLL